LVCAPVVGLVTH